MHWNLLRKSHLWRVLYANPAFLETAGLGAEDAAELSLRNVLVPLGRRTVFWRGLQVMAITRRAFGVERVKLRGSADADGIFTLTFRPASHDHVDADALPVGCPLGVALRGSGGGDSGGGDVDGGGGGDGGCLEGQQLYLVSLQRVDEDWGAALADDWPGQGAAGQPRAPRRLAEEGEERQKRRDSGRQEQQQEQQGEWGQWRRDGADGQQAEGREQPLVTWVPAAGDEPPSINSGSSLDSGPPHSPRAPPKRRSSLGGGHGHGCARGPFGQLAAAPELPGLVLRQLLGSCAQGRVYLADQDGGGPVAVKVVDLASLQPARVGRVQLQQLRQELEAGISIEHPNVVRTLAAALVGTTAADSRVRGELQALTGEMWAQVVRDDAEEEARFINRMMGRLPPATDSGRGACGTSVGDGPPGGGGGGGEGPTAGGFAAEGRAGGAAGASGAATGDLSAGGRVAFQRSARSAGG
ncbi:hypothetical protein MNEG_15818 [Monoraphidium neglectum]|uniref:Protein kinase domain-containing protein n=1 Tax=Monoraphidium neglectum TaxID=145388 RepID=A0A0D2M9X8_9CHLO|nr:hypothetical protein MNEG_15818 [Monoraphidium neglectum]KIY92145.1 hypothetical protein MNEG_15818 [Monoraphidium neglectum]|eukprot:XP_013891165.1 hypothetical protein MNEG_15818 [Monoraphidium neglectum]